jgi:large repetitive protein
VQATNLSVGSHTIVTTYNGDTTHTPSSSPPVAQVINKGNDDHRDRVNDGTNPSTYGQPLSFTATITGQFSGSMIGTVAFKDGGAVIATVGLNGTTATFTTTTVLAGSHSISATYGGDSNSNGSSSSPLAQSVNQASTTTRISASTNASVQVSGIARRSSLTATAPLPTVPSTVWSLPI